ncbi:TonB-dependent siderophore receptor [Acinetobacter sp. C26M]|uniref:TonB-dependent receptor family protein n=1 Tax=unclassified Acinetobacter TaxID=196816 RepID=UPI002036BB2B|nr:MULTISPECIES: TonB-dependent siderophore receptor [unclassified Acinetobacter]USA45647.1 TonB-dependent siderophore receptor [Acinetobacter sp. C26M]USA49146.1 TonB-dependent siderophore receptor [Acinetobacter sp. C26G]
MKSASCSAASLIKFQPSYLSLAIAISLSGISHAAFANEAQPNETQTLATISIQAQGNWLENANAEKVQQHAGARTIIDRKRLDEIATTSIRDALKQIPGVQVQDSNGTGGSDVSLNLGVRGLASRLSPRSTVLMDGVPLSFAPYGQPQLSLAPVSMGNIESVDVVRGAGSVRFGPQNVGGIINFTTRAIPQAFSGSVGLTTEFATGTDQLKYTPNLFIGGTLDNGLGLALLYSGSKGDGYREANNKIDIDDVMLKTAYQWTDQDAIAVNLHHYEGRGEMPEGLTAAQFADNPYQSNQSRNYFAGRRSDVSVKYSHKDEQNNFELLGYYVDSFRTSDLESIGNKGTNILSNSPRDYKYFGIEPRYSRAYSWAGMDNEVTVGYRYLQEESSEFSGRTVPYSTLTGTPGDRIPNTTSDGGTKAHAVYIDNRFGLANWVITPGVRFESIDTHNDFTAYQDGVVTNTVYPKIKSEEFLPSLSVLYKANENWNIFANAGVSFGPQQYNQLVTTQMVNKTTNTAFTTLDGLHPEKSKNYEIGTKYLGNGLSAELTVFYLDFDKELMLERPDNIGTGIWTNLGATSHKGVETGISYDFGQLADALEGLKVYGNYTFTKATSEAGKFEGKDLSYYSRHIGNLGIAYQVDHWSVNADMFAQSKQYAPGSGNVYQTEETADGRTGNIPGYSTFAVRAGYDFSNQLNGLKIAGGVKNVFDTQYYTRSSDATGGKYVGQPRTFFLQTSYDF